MAAYLRRRHGMGRSKAVQERRRVGKMFCLCLFAGSSRHVFEAVAVGTAEGERCRGRRPARWMQRMMQLGFAAEVEGKAREKEALHVGQQYHSSIGGRDKDNYILEFFE